MPASPAGGRFDVPDPYAKQVAVTCDLATAYRLGLPYTTGNMSTIVTAFDGEAKQTEAFSISSTGGVFRIYMDGSSDSGWSSQDLQFPGLATDFMAATLADGTRIVYAVDRAKGVYFKHSTNQWTESWQSVPAFPTDVGGTDQTRGVWARGIVRDATGQDVPCFLVYSALNSGVGFLATLENGQWNVRPSLCEQFPWDLRSFPARLRKTPGAPPVIGAYRIFDELDAGTDRLDAYRGDMDWVSLTGHWRAYRTYPSADGTMDDVLAADEAGQVYLVGLDAAAAELTATLVPGAQGLLYRGGLVRRRSTGVLDLFLVDSKWHLHHGHQDSASASGWSDFIPVATDLLIDDIYTSARPDDSIELFATTSGQALYRLSKDLSVADAQSIPQNAAEWQIEAIEIGGPSEQVDEVRAYVAQVVVHDASMSPLANASVTIFSDDGVWADINGVHDWIDAGRPFSTKTNDQGQVLITVPTTSVGVPALGLWFSAMPPGDRVAIDLSANIQTQLGGTNPATGIDAAQLRSAKIQDSEGQRAQPLIPEANSDGATVESVANALSSAIKMLDNAGSHDAVARPEVFHHANDTRVTRYLLARTTPQGPVAPPLRLLHRPSVPEQTWRVSFATGKPVYSALSAEDAAHHLDQALALPRLRAKAPGGVLTMASTGRVLSSASAAAVGDTDGWSWGDIWEAVKSGLATVYDYTVQPVIDAVNAVITLVIEGVTYVFNCVVSLAQQVFDLVEEVFRRIAVGFEQLFHWLGEVIGWQGVLRTKEMLKGQLLQMLDIAGMAMPVVESLITGKIAGFQKDLADAVTRFNQQVLGTQLTLGANQQRAADQTPAGGARDMQRAQGMNLIGNGLHNHVNGATASSAPHLWLALPPDAIDPLNDFLTWFGTTGGQWAAAKAFQDAVDYFTQIPNDPEHAAQLLLSAIISALEAILQLVLDVAIIAIRMLARAVAAVLQSIRTMWDSPALWRIPFVSPLYKKVCGTDLTPLDLSALIVAMPATWLYRIQHETAPFPDDASLTSFQAAFSTPALAGALGLTPTGTGITTIAPPAPTAEQKTVAEQIFLWLNAINNLVHAATDVYLDTQVTDKIANKFNIQIGGATSTGIMTWNAFAAGWVGLACGVTWHDLPKMEPGCDTSDKVGAIDWIVEAVENLVNLCFVAKFGRLARSADEQYGPWIASGFGVVHLSLSIHQGVKAVDEAEGDPLGTLESVLGSVPASLKFLRTDALIEATELGSWFVLLIFDLACGIGTSAFGLARAYRASAAPAH